MELKQKRVKKKTASLRPVRHGAQGAQEKIESPNVRVSIVGIGGGAGSILSSIAPRLKKVNFVLLDTDERSFKKLPPKVRKILFGTSFTKGWGTGMNPEVGRKAVKEVLEKLKIFFENKDFVILISCLGGGVGSGATPEVARLLHDLKKNSLGIFTLPFSFEGEKKRKIAQNALELIKPNLSGTIALSNETILEFLDKKTSLKKALFDINELLVKYLESLIDIISLAGIINIDLADLKTTLSGWGKDAFFSQGQGGGANRVESAINALFGNPFFAPPSHTQRVLFNIASGGDLNIKEVERVGQEIARLNPKARIIFGISKNPSLKGLLSITLLGVGENTKFSNKGSKSEKVVSKKESSKKRKNSSKNSSENEKSVQKTKNQQKKTKRKSAIELKKEKEKQKEEEFFNTSDWEIPPFLKKNYD